MSFSLFFQGFATSGALIVAIGAQNAFVLRQGLRREHVLLVALLCSFSDALLMTLGVAGMGAIVQSSPVLLATARYGGAMFLLYYGALAARRAWRSTGEALELSDQAAPSSVKKTVLMCLAFTYLNPHCYLDTVVLVGSISAQFEGQLKWVFGAGAVCASFVWFFSLAYGARLLAPLFQKPIAWRVLDAIIALVMVGLAVALLL